MRVLEIDHPLVAHKLTVLRNRATHSSVFRQLADELVTLLAYEATRNVAVAPAQIETPVTTMTGTRLTNPKPMVVPILRAGLGMLDGLTRLLPTAEVGFLGMVRNDETLEVTTYANRLPDDLSGRQCFVLDPMLATGHTLIASCAYLHERAPHHRGGLPGHRPQRRDPRGHHPREPPAGRPLRPSVLRARPDARHRPHPHRLRRVPARARGPRHHLRAPAVRARGPEGHGRRPR